MTALTPDETRALEVAAQGHTAAMCGRLLGCSARHYGRLAASARDALGARSLVHAVAIAAASGLITVTPARPTTPEDT